MTRLATSIALILAIASQASAGERQIPTTAAAPFVNPLLLKGFNPQPEPPGSRAALVGLNPQPSPPGALVGLNPQPEPPTRAMLLPAVQAAREAAR